MSGKGCGDRLGAEKCTAPRRNPPLRSPMRGRPRIAMRRRPAGFTLLEVVVALFIAGLALAVLFRAGSAGLYATDTAQKAQEALERAQSHLAAIGRDVALVAGVSEGKDGGGFRWRLSVQPLASRQTAAANGASLVTTTLYDVQVAISWKAGGKTRRVVLVTRRLGTALAPR
jgi:general secretion pathway protein I